MKLFPSRQQGVTLVELVIAIVVIGIAVSGVLLAMNHTIARSADPLIQHQAVAIAEAYMEEILLRPFLDPDGAGGESRPNYDDVFDYNGLSQAPTDQNNQGIAGLGAYTVAVQVTPDTLNGVPAARIDVRVQNGNVVDFTLTGYRTNY